MRLSKSEKLALDWCAHNVPYYNTHTFGQSRIGLNTWSSLRGKGLVAEGYPYRLTEAGACVAIELQQAEK